MKNVPNHLNALFSACLRICSPSPGTTFSAVHEKETAPTTKPIRDAGGPGTVEVPEPEDWFPRAPAPRPPFLGLTQLATSRHAMTGDHLKVALAMGCVIRKEND